MPSDYRFRTLLGQHTLPLSVLAAMIRLGRKFDFQNLFEFAVARLTAQYPATLEKSDAFESEQKEPYIERYIGLHFDLITLASENNIVSVLPCAYYRAMESFSLVSPVYRT